MIMNRSFLLIPSLFSFLISPVYSFGGDTPLDEPSQTRPVSQQAAAQAAEEQPDSDTDSVSTTERYGASDDDSHAFSDSSSDGGSDLESQLIRKKAKIKKLKKKLLNLQDDNDELNRRLDDAEEELGATERQLDKAEEERDAAIVARESAQKELESLKPTPSHKLITELREKIMDLKDRKSNLRDKYNDVRRAKDLLGDELSKVVAERNELEARNKELSARLAKRPDPNPDLIAEIETLTQQLSVLRDEKRRLHQAHHEAAQKAHGKEQKIQVLEKKLHELEEQQKTILSKAISEKEESFKAQTQGLTKRIHTLDKTLAQSRDDIQALHRTLKEKEDILTRYRKEIDSFKAKAQGTHDLEARHHAEMKQKISALEQERAGLAEKLSQQDRSYQDQLQKFKEERATLSEKARKLEAQHTAAMGRLQILARVQREKERLSQQVSVLQKKLEAEVSEHKRLENELSQLVHNLQEIQQVEKERQTAYIQDLLAQIEFLNEGSVVLQSKLDQAQAAAPQPQPYPTQEDILKMIQKLQIGASADSIFVSPEEPFYTGPQFIRILEAAGQCVIRAQTAESEAQKAREEAEKTRLKNEGLKEELAKLRQQVAAQQAQPDQKADL